jgi:hypothetical protein
MILLISILILRAVGLMLELPVYPGSEDRKQEYKTLAIATLHAFSECLAVAAGDAQSEEVRKAAILVIKQVLLLI